MLVFINNKLFYQNRKYKVHAFWDGHKILRNLANKRTFNNFDFPLSIFFLRTCAFVPNDDYEQQIEEDDWYIFTEDDLMIEVDGLFST